jgi:iron complex transport system substrate-binding protein
MVFATEKAGDIGALEKIPTFGKLDEVQGNRAVFTDGTLAGAIYFTSPLSLPYVLERLTPALARAVKGESPREMLQAP